MLALAQNIEERSVAATDIEDARVGRNHRNDVFVEPLLPLHDFRLSRTQETAHKPREVVDVGEERVVSGAGFEVAICHAFASTLE